MPIVAARAPGVVAVVRAVAILAVASASLTASADRIVLKNGHVIEADRAWIQGHQVMYEKNGGVLGLPLTLVEKLDQRAQPLATADPDVQRARVLLTQGNAVEAARILQRVATRDPFSLPAQQELAEAQRQLGNGHAAWQAALQALKIDERNPRSRELLGDALALLADRAGAEEAYRRSLLLRPDPRVQAKLDAVRATLPAPLLAQPTVDPPLPSAVVPRAAGAGALGPPSPGGAELRLRYDGGVNEPLGGAVLEAAGVAYGEYQTRFGLTPQAPLTIVLQTDAAFQEGGTPLWAAGLNDGTIRVPVHGLERVTPGLVRVLRHELAHSFVAARTGGNCPTWVHEGVAQWLEGGDPARADAGLAPLARARKLLPLLSLEGPFQNLVEREAQQAYAQSLSAVTFILRRKGEAGVMRLLAALGDGLPSEEALPVALALSYPEFQREWEAGLAPAPRSQ